MILNSLQFSSSGQSLHPRLHPQSLRTFLLTHNFLLSHLRHLVTPCQRLSPPSPPSPVEESLPPDPGPEIDPLPTPSAEYLRPPPAPVSHEIFLSVPPQPVSVTSQQKGDVITVGGEEFLVPAELSPVVTLPEYRSQVRYSQGTAPATHPHQEVVKVLSPHSVASQPPLSRHSVHVNNTFPLKASPSTSHVTAIRRVHPECLQNHNCLDAEICLTGGASTSVSSLRMCVLVTLSVAHVTHPAVFVPTCPQPSRCGAAVVANMTVCP
ncbi:uncharacterized protein LOC121865069 [Homarus americanus]|uniref:Uncharacterized protein n=1 Tax=Homarus americanus TaxID=6706 RepID=A0A8J5K3Y6_HOMAM|nr:uncharacterized protein LOC121865069 [Homarus americanus]KAG7170132.1 hypothetical protein Hamer_G012373 [Homarus americanus]